MPEFFRYAQKIFYAIEGLLVILLFLLNPIQATAIIYQPGETLDPACLPSDSNCTVDVTLFDNTLTLSSTTSPSTPTNQLYNIGGALYWNGSQLSGLSNIVSLNGLTGAAQIMSVGTSGTDFNVTTSGSSHVFNIPSASSSNRGLLTASDWNTFNAKQAALGYTPLNASSNLSDLASASTARTNLGIGSVENTAVSTWVGSTNITTLGTITSGTWNGTTIAVINGGTGSTNGSITGTGALSFTSATTNALTLDSGTTGAINIGSSSFAKTITIGNTTGATAVNINSGTGNINLQSAGTSTTGSVQIGAGGAGSATPDLLVLDAKSTSGDPTGTNGAVYYNTNSNKFRCYQNGSWQDCISSSGNNSYFKDKTSDQAITSTTTLTSDNDLTFPVNSGETWAVNYELYITNNNSGQPDLQLAVLGASGWSCSLQMSGFEAAGTNFPQIVTTDCDNSPTAMINASVGNDSGKGITVHVFGTITTTSSGSITLQFAQNTSSLNALTMKAGSFVAAFRTAGSDVAEIYYGDEALVPGTVVSLNPEKTAGVVKSRGVNDTEVIGVVSTSPGLIIGDNKPAEGAIPAFVALSGRVPVMVSTENGSIRPGDYLAPSSTPGMAMRANKNSVIIGQALSGFEGDSLGQVLMFVKNFDLSSNALLLGDISNLEGLSTDFVSKVLSEDPKNPIEIIGQKISEGKQFLTDFFATRVTAIRGYFEELFTKKLYADEICMKKSDDSSICFNADQFGAILQNNQVELLTPPPEEQTQEEEIPEPTELPEEIESPVDQEPQEVRENDNSAPSEEPTPEDSVSDLGEVQEIPQ